MSTPRPIVAAVLACMLVIALGAAAPAGSATPRQFTPPVLEPLTEPVPAEIRDRVFAAEPSAAAAARARRLLRAPTTYTTADGYHVDVEVSNDYPPNPVAEQALVDFLASLTHGDELGRLGVYVATPLEMPTICGGLAAACYFPGDDTMVIVGEASFGGLPTNFVTAHEYGHHVENHRKNTPWPALGWGTKRWSTGERVCPRYLAGTLFPGERSNEFPGSDEDFYWQNPGEAFAEAYALSHPEFANQPWDWITSLLPGAPDYSRIRADVTDPWTGNTTKRYRSRLADFELLRKSFPTSLDGKVVVKLRGPKGTNFDLALTDARHRPLAVSTGPGSREKVKSYACGDEKLYFDVLSGRRAGRAKVSVSKP